MGIFDLKNCWHLWLIGIVFATAEAFFLLLVYIKYVLVALIVYLLVAIPLAGPELVKRGWAPPEWLLNRYSGRAWGLLPGLTIAVVLPCVGGYVIGYLFYLLWTLV